MADSLAILPSNFSKDGKPPGSDFRPAKASFIPEEKGGLLLKDPNEAPCPYTFSDSPAYLRAKEAEERAKRANELEAKEETRGFLRNVEELGKKHKWDEVSQLLERRTAVTSGLFLVTRAVLRWKYSNYGGALRDVEEALKEYGSSAKAGPLAAAFASFARICLGSQARDKDSCSREMRSLVAAWEQAEVKSAEQTSSAAAKSSSIFKPRKAEKLTSAVEVVESMEACDGNYVVAVGVRIGYVLVKNKKDLGAPVILHFHGSAEVAADYRSTEMVEKYRDLNVHLLAVDYRGYGWSAEQPSFSTFLRDAEVLAEGLQNIFIEHGLAWPYSGGLILSGRSLGAQVAIHLATVYPSLFRAMILDSAWATSVAGDRLGRAPERAAALECWHKELAAASLEVLKPLDVELFRLSALEKIKRYEGQLLVLHGSEDEIAPADDSENLCKTCESKQKEFILVQGAGHNNIGRSDEFWNAQKRFALRVTLDDTLPSIGPVVHLCAICHEKAAAKCGGCEKVWYCGRKHQAEHWKQHKLVCSGKPSQESQPKAKPEAEACLVAVHAVNITSETEFLELKNTLMSLVEQREEAFQSILVGWHANNEDLGDQVELLLAEVRQKAGIPLVAEESKAPFTFFEHAKAISRSLASTAPKHAWISVVDQGSLVSASYAATLLPELRRAAVDAKVVAQECDRHVVPAEGSTAGSVADVDASYREGRLSPHDSGSKKSIGDFVVKLQTFQAFLKSTPASVLSLDDLCSHLYLHKLTNSFGKKVVVFAAPEGEWMRYVKPVKESEESIINNEDRAMGRQLFEGVKSAELLESPDQAALEMCKLRKRVDRRIVLLAGQAIAAKDLHELGREEMEEFLSRTGLEAVVGLHRWCRQVADDLSDAAAERCAVRLE